MARRIEVVSGALVAAVGLAALIYAAFGPTGQYSSCTSGGACVSGSRSLWQEGLAPGAVLFIIGVVLLCIAVASCAYLHSRYGSRAALVGLWILWLLLLGGTIISALSLGIFLALPTVLTLVAAISATMRQARGGDPSPAYGM